MFTDLKKWKETPATQSSELYADHDLRHIDSFHQLLFPKDHQNLQMFQWHYRNLKYTRFLCLQLLLLFHCQSLFFELYAYHYLRHIDSYHPLLLQ